MPLPNHDASSAKRRRFGAWIAILALYVLGAFQWADFFSGPAPPEANSVAHFGRLTFRAFDWPKERLYLQVWQDAFREGRLPLHVQAPEAYIREFPQLANHGGRTDDYSRPTRFLALPETILSPQIVLLRFLSPGRFILLHFLLLYTAGFVGCLWIRARRQLSIVPFAVLFLLFNLNGYITSHLGVGHVMWGGYFLLPFVALFILEWMGDKAGVAPGLKLAVVLFVMLLQGSLHLVVWCWIFIGLVVAWNPMAWRSGVIAVTLSALLAGFRLVPAAVAYWGFPGLPFGGGYPTPLTLLEALLVIRDAGYRPFGGIYWWEYDLYIGLAGLAILAYFGVYQRLVRDPYVVPLRFAALDVPLVVMVVMAMSDLFYPIYSLPIPLLNSERVTSRFIIVPFILLLLLSVIRMQAVAGSRRIGAKAIWVIALGILVMWRSLTSHMLEWTVANLERLQGSVWHELGTATFVERTDRAYTWGLVIGSLVSVIGVVAWLYAYRRQRMAEPGR